ncbi:MAG: Ig-like domain-containing protein [Bacillota bacterium]
MSCSEIIDYLEEYIHDDLDRELKEQINSHLNICPHCMEEYRRLKSSAEKIRDAYNNINIPDSLKNISTSKTSKMKNRFYIKRAVLAAACVFVLLSGMLLIPNSLFTHWVSAEEYRGGFHLAPLDFDATGVKPDSEFILKSQKEISLDELKESLSIDNEPSPEITQQSPGIFRLKPYRLFEQNRLYTFRIKTENSDDITWTFQTSSAFKIAGTFPGDKTTDVPTNSGIEIYLSHEDYEDIDKFFEISPFVEGRFERHKRAVVFVPKELKEATVYTVKIKKGLKLKGTDHSLKEDYTFQFETTSSNTYGENTYKGYFSYTQNLNEYLPGEKPYLSLNYGVSKEGTKINVKTLVYSYRDISSFMEALKKKDSLPFWAFRSSVKNVIPVDGLQKVLEFEQVLSQNSSYDQFIKVPYALPVGFYLVDSKWEDINFQTFIQVTEVGMYTMKANNKTLVWLNDLKEQKPAVGAKISLPGTKKEYFSDTQGIACFDTALNENKAANNTTYFKITTKDNKSAVLACSSNIYGAYGDNGQSLYWNYIQLDRNLYKPDDSVNFWGLVKSRYADEKIDSVTLEIDQGHMYFDYFRHMKSGGSIVGYYPTNTQPLVKKEIKAASGIFKGSFKLPNLDPGGYQLFVKKDGKVIASSYLSVENFTKPAYRLEITKNKEAIFPGEEVIFDIKGSFFEGTGVPKLDVSYNINAYHEGGKNINERAFTDSSGNMRVKYTANSEGDIQGEQLIGIYTHSVLPEMGEISSDSSVRLFVNDVNVNLSSDIKNNKGVVNAALNKIVLERLNNGTAKDSSDYLGDAVEGRALNGTIYKNTWVKVEDGQYYDFINKVTQKRYRYDHRKEEFKSFSITTDSSGKATFSFDAPKIEDGYYSAVVKCQDNSGRSMKYDIHIGDYADHFYRYEDNRYYLDGGKENYKIGDRVELTYKKSKNPLPKGSYLFIKTQNGIRDYEIKNGPEYSFTVEEKDVPNIYVTGVYFNGITYVRSEEFNALFDYKDKNLALEASLDKTSYKPGEEVTVKLQAKDKNGNGKKAVVNASIVDEALFKLHEQHIDTLAALYSSVPSGVEASYQSHMNSGREMFVGSPTGKGGGVWGDGKFQITFSEPVAKSNVAPTASINNTDFSLSYDPSMLSVNSTALTVVRQDFKDTANFETVTLNDEGYGELRFRLPDNITSWRITLSGVTTDLHAGSNKVSLNVSLPFFINYTLNSTYLVGDKPALGVTAYGNDLGKDDQIIFEVSSNQNPDFKVKAYGKAFERVNIPLWELSEGKTDIIIKASSASGLGDSLKHSITTVKTYHQIEEAVYYDLKPGMRIEGGSTGNTQLVFADKSRGSFISDLNALRYTSGNRIDQKLPAKKASELLGTYFKQYGMEDSGASFNVSGYQREDGGIAILPYGESDLDISARISSLIKDEVNPHKLKDFFYAKYFDNSPGVKTSALYGLAVLREPVLLNLDKVSEIENLSVKDLIYLALAYCELGETPKANRIYTDKIVRYIDELKPYYRINTGKDNDDVLECTSLAALLASMLDKPQKSGLYQYCISNEAKDILTSIERLLYVDEEIKKARESRVSFRYSMNGESHSKILENGESFILTVPSVDLGNFKIESVEGDIALVSFFKKSLTKEIKKDSNLNVKRTYTVKGGSEKSVTAFNQNDIIKVVITWGIGAKAIDGGYQITDYLPSGLKAIENPVNMGVDPRADMSWGEIDGQKITFYISKDFRGKRHVTYYARVVNPGTYNTDSTIIQSVASKESLNFGEPETVVINY